MSSENERFGDIMPVIIERIIRFESDLAIPYRDEE